MSETSKEDYCHDFERGDHVIRWTNILIYPVQVHGIVLSAGAEIVTIVDFGASTAKSQKNNEATESQELEEMIDQEDQAMVQACEEHRKEHLGADRIHIITLTDEKEINRWKKVNYGEELKKQKDWRWWKNGEENEKNSTLTTESSGEMPQDDVRDTSTDTVDSGIPNSTELHPKKPSNWWSACRGVKTEDAKEDTKAEIGEKKPALPKSDPEHLVLSRVRFLLTNPQELPPHHILFSNSECIAVWCKTGRWSTLQASIFLYSTAAGNLKTMILSSSGAAAATTSVTVPASGIAGWFGMTTTTTVSLLSVQPWLIPVLAGYGLIAVGTPILLAKKAKERWEEATAQLNDAFWSNAESDVYVEAIKSWSILK